MILAVNPLLIVKALSLVKDHWKPILVAVLSFILLILMIPTILFSLFLPATEETNAQEYVAFSKAQGIDWMEVLAFDTVRYDNDFTKADPNDTAFEFITVTFETLEDVCVKYQTKNKVKTCIEWETEITSSQNLTTKTSIINILKSIGYHPKSDDFLPVIEALKSADSTSSYNFIIKILTLDKVMENNKFTNEQKEWANSILDSQVLYDLYGGFSGSPGDTSPPVFEGSNGWSWVTSSTRLTDYFGTRGGNHKGIDVGAVSRGVDGDPIYAMTEGVIITSRYSTTAGNFIVIDHGNNLKTRYLHLVRVGLPVGTVVKKGQSIGQMGTTGDSSGTHLHFEVLLKGNAVNPLAYFPNIK
jgi:murein DD-endopeptidase MepM/ murein hydrolase activator NlpD